MTKLSEMSCEKLNKESSPASKEQVNAFLPQIPAWEVIEVGGIQRLERVFKFKNFIRALEFTNAVGALAEAEDHHPALLTEWGKVRVTWWTHVAHGLHQNDFIAAAKTDLLYAE